MTFLGTTATLHTVERMALAHGTRATRPVSRDRASGNPSGASGPAAGVACGLPTAPRARAPPRRGGPRPPRGSAPPTPGPPHGARPSSSTRDPASHYFLRFLCLFVSFAYSFSLAALGRNKIMPSPRPRIKK